MRTWIKYVGPPGWEPLPPTILPADMLADYEIKIGDTIWVKAECSYTRRNCIVKEIDRNEMCPDGRRANVLVVQELATFN